MEKLRLFVKPEASLLLTDISRILSEEGIPSYLVGGFARDMLLGRDTGDIDIAVGADALQIAPRLAAALDGKHVPLDEVNRVGRVILQHKATKEKFEIDVATLKGDIERDLAERDFTVDAIAIKLERFTLESPTEVALSPSALIDPFSGYHDLQDGIIRAVGSNAFKSDPARLLRAVRLAAELGFAIDSKTQALIQEDCHLIADVAGERVREELLRILALPQAGRILAFLDELGLVTAMIPELAPGKGVSQPLIHFWDVFDHSLQTVTALEFLLRQETWEYASTEILSSVPWSAALREHFNQEVSSGSTRQSLLKLAALLHDIAKPQTKTMDENGRARFLGHPRDGAVTAANVLERLRFSTREIKLVEAMVKDHLRPTQMSHEGLPSRRAIYRYFRDTGDAGIAILFLNLADHLATRGPQLDLEQWQEHAQMVEYIINKQSEEESLVVPPKLINGHDIINNFGLSPGPRIGELLEAVREALAAGEVTTKEQAFDYIRHLLTNQTRTSHNELN